MTDAAPAKSGVLGNILRFFLVRFFLFANLLLLAYAGMEVLGAELPKRFPKEDADAITLGVAAALVVVMIAVYVLLVRVLERRGAKEISILPGIPLAIAGALLGFVLFTATIAILWALHIAQWSGLLGYVGLMPAIAMAIGAAVGEEIVFRGGIFRVLEDSFGTFIALVISSALFGLIHAGNAGATTLSTVAIALEAGLLLGAAYIATRNLWLPIGLHFGWNFTEGGIFGAAVSGGQFQGMSKVTFTGTDLMTGSKFGPEASVIAVAVCLVAALVLAILAIRGGRWKPLRFKLLLD